MRLAAPGLNYPAENLFVHLRGSLPIMEKIERNLLRILAGLGVLLLLGAIAVVVASLPPRGFTFLSGRQGGAYYLGAQLYQQYAAQKGFTVKIVETSGSVEALRMLEEGKGDVAFVQGGIAAQGNPAILSTLATVAYEPVWIFYRRELAPDQPLSSPVQLRGLRVNIGEVGSGTNPFARLLLEDYGLTDNDVILSELATQDALDKLQSGELDAAILVLNPVSPLLQEIMRDRRLEMMTLADAEALARRHRFLSTLDLPKGTIDLVDVFPREDVKLISPSVNLVVRNDLHPDILRLLAFTAVELHSPGGFFSQRKEFPSTLNGDLPVSKEGEAYLERIKNNEFMLDNYLPFWAAAMFDRYLLFVVPLLLIALPMLARSPVLYQIYMRRKVNRWYKEVRTLEMRVESMSVAEVDAAIAELDTIDDTLAHELSVSSEYMPNLYALRTHIDYVSRRLQRRKATMIATPVI